MSEPNGCIRAFAIDLVSREPDAPETTDPRLREGVVERVAHARGPFRGVAAELGEHLDGHRAELTGYCSRMLGSHVEAEDAVQETLIRAWRGFDRFEGRAALRTWLYGIATNVCFDHLRSGRRRAHPIDLGPGSSADALLGPTRPAPATGATALEATDPADVAISREEARAAFAAAVRRLPPRQRAVLFLRDVLRWRAREVGDLFGVTVPSVNSALQRARATLADGNVAVTDPSPPLGAEERALLDRYVAAFEAYDIDALTTLIQEDATQSMPPFDLWLRGRDDIFAWWFGPGIGCRGSRLVPTVTANGSPAYGQYKPAPDGGYEPWALQVIEIADGRIGELTFFLDTKTLFPLFGLPDRLEA
jgi:RNA polymerase sigma-70 factor, ECF subfamily